MNELIEFITHDEYNGIICEPFPAYKKFPDWFSDTEVVSKKKSKCPFVFTYPGNFLKVDRKTNVTTCPGIIDYLSTGYIIPSWNNFLVRTFDTKLHIEWEHDFRETYSLHQTINHVPGFSKENEPKYEGFSKILTPWYIKTSPGVSCLITNPTMYRDNRFTTVSGIVHTDKRPIPLSWFFEWNLELNSDEFQTEMPREQFISIGEPLIHIIPFRRKQFTSKIKYLDNYSTNIMKYKSSVFLHDWDNNSLYVKFRKSIKKLFR